MLKGNTLNKAVAAMVLCAAVLFGGQQLWDGADSTPAGSVREAETSNANDSVRYSELPTIAVADLPVEALETLERIDNNEEQPYSKDGSVFQNREGILPDQQVGHYQEFTVDTPGSQDRGARRVVTGQDGERFYTSDHYASFVEIVY